MKKGESNDTLAKDPSTWSKAEGEALPRPLTKSRSKPAFLEATDATAAVAKPPSKRATGNQAGGTTSTGSAGPAGQCSIDDVLLKRSTVAKPSDVESHKFELVKAKGFQKLFGKGP